MAVTSILGLLFGDNYGTVIGGLELDASISSSHERQAQVTQSPVEDGAAVHDHVILDPERVTVEGFVTDSPAVIFGGVSGRGRTQDAVEKLEELWQARQPIQIDTGLKQYPTMIITRLSLPDERKGSMQFTLEAQEIRIVDSEIREVPDDALAGDVADSAAETTQAGRQTAQEAGSAAADRSSVLFDLTEGLF